MGIKKTFAVIVAFSALSVLGGTGSFAKAILVEPGQPSPILPHRPNPVEPAAPDSIEGKLASQGKHWAQVNEPIAVGSYVEDILKNRLNQPTGRGWIGKVLSIDKDAAQVDFGRGYKVGIALRELRRIRIITPHPQHPTFDL